MSDLQTTKYIRTDTTRPSFHAEVTAPIPVLYCDENYGNKGFWMYWKCIQKPYIDELETHKHDFDQYLVFLGGDPANMLDLGGEIEFTMSLDGIYKEKHIFTRYTTVYIPAGLYHCPLVYKTVTKPIIFYDFVNTLKYNRKFTDAVKSWQPKLPNKSDQPGTK
jgi:hypothetical protein